MRTLGLLMLVTGCTPILPFHLAETAEILKKGSVSLTVGGGGGGGRDVSACCGGGTARVSFGVGRNQEVGFETTLVGGDPHALYLLAKLRYKLGLGRHLALLAGVGATGTVDTSSGDGNAGLGADLGLVASTDLLAKIVRIYGGARFSFVFGARRDLYDGVPTQAFVVPAGLAFELRPSWHLFVEGGLLGGFSEYRDERRLQTGQYIGGYGLFAFSYTWNP